MDVVLNSEIRSQFSGDRADAERVTGLIAECKAAHVELDRESIAYACGGYLDRLSEHWRKAPEDSHLLRLLVAGAKMARALPFDCNLWKTQNIFYDISRSLRREWVDCAAHGDAAAKEWVSLSSELGDGLGFSIPEHPGDEKSNEAPGEVAKPELVHAG